MAKNRKIETAHCVMALNASGEGPKRTIPLMPKPMDDGTITGRDGRYWKLIDPEAVLTASNDYIEEFGAPLDEGHKMFVRPEGAPAFGWFQSFAKNSSGGIDGSCDLNDLGTNAVDNKHYRYASVVFDYDLDTLEILVIRGAGLTNNQNLQVQALNSQQHPSRGGQQQEKEMDPILKQILVALNISESDAGTAPDRVKELLGKETALNSQGAVVPQAQFDQLKTALNTAKGKLEKLEGDAFKAKVDTALNAASKAGKLTPAAREKWEKTITDETALNNFESVMGASPVLTKDQQVPDGEPPTGATALNQAEKELGDVFGNSEEDLKKYGA